jgi:outer membrane immunogenic protein
MRVSGPIVIALIAMSVPATAEAQSRWNGPYIGINGGYSWHDVRTTHVEMETRGTVFGIGPVLPATRYGGEDGRETIKGAFGGAQVGYGWQHQALVIGIEADVQRGDTSSSNVTVASNLGPTYRSVSRIGYWGTLRARLGYDVGGWLFYGTGGLAFAQASADISVSPGTPWAPVAGGPFAGGDTMNYLGYAIGGGVEIPLAAFLAVKVEYLHADLGTEPLRVDLSGSDGSFIVSDEALAFDIVRLGLNMRF